MAKDEDYEEGLEEDGSKFNMALATYKRLDNILIQMTMLSINVPDFTRRCQIKFQLLKQFNISSIPLIEKSVYKQRIKEELNKVSQLFHIRSNQANKTSRVICDPCTEDRIDEVLAMIQEILQEKKIFMPSKDSSDIF